MGGWLGDKFASTTGLTGRVRWLIAVMVAEGITLLVFSRMDVLGIAVISMIVFSLCVQMAEGATYSVVPFINKRSLGAVAGIVGAGGNVGAVCYAQFFLRSGLPLEDVFLYLGFVVSALGLLGLGVRFPEEVELQAKNEFQAGQTAGASV
jgi:NNP family nitrate/nitrite transporter-like MFS transporter